MGSVSRETSPILGPNRGKSNLSIMLRLAIYPLVSPEQGKGVRGRYLSLEPA